jgi:hypothetical protein
MIKMVVRASGIPEGTVQLTNYKDDADIPKWAKTFASTAQLNGIVISNGVSDNKFAPQALSTRAEAASVIVKMLKVKK